MERAIRKNLPIVRFEGAAKDFEDCPNDSNREDFPWHAFVALKKLCEMKRI